MNLHVSVYLSNMRFLGPHLAPISAAKGPHLVPISLKIRSPFGPHFDKFRSPFHVGAVEVKELSMGEKKRDLSSTTQCFLIILQRNTLLMRPFV